MNPERITEFRNVTAATARALSENPKLAVSFKSGDSRAGGNTVFISRPSNTDGDEEIDRLRGQADTAAFWSRYHDDELAIPVAAGETKTYSLFGALEAVRCDCLGANSFAGVAKNLQAHFQHEYGRSPLSTMPDLHPEQLATAVVIFAREVLGGLAPPAQAEKAFEDWRQMLTPHLDYFHAMAESLQEQEDFATHAGKLLTVLGFPGAEPDDNELTLPPSEVQSNLLNEHADSAEETGDDAAVGAQHGVLRESRATAPLPGEDVDQPLIDGSGGIPNAFFDVSPALSSEYRVYTDEFDEIVDAGSLRDRSELVRLRTQLDDHIGKLSNIVGRLSSRLQRRLLAKQNRGWEFDLEEGELDTSRLSRVIVNPLNTLSFKREREIKLHDTVVSCLIDNSGSMRGKPVLLAAITADMIARTLERCRVKVEILGFTTRAWKGGRARARWLASGQPAQPGRLNDLRHIIYKSADTPWRRARLGLGLMLREGLLKENIDGEALAWAYRRLRSRHEQRKILIVISDGAPVDDATLSANSGSILDQHLRQVIAEIEVSGQVELSAIGIGHDVTRYYRRALTLVDADQLGKALTDELVELLDPTPGFGH
ncbi:MAG: cobaltochelatase subunit CobT [Gammaproteobacteria bacterium]|nr:cobaltochelatase subunit CobT [Gammaproteobacteria bacterium]